MLCYVCVCAPLQVMRFDVVALPGDIKARPFTADEQCALNSALKHHWESTTKPIDKSGSYQVRRVRHCTKQSAVVCIAAAYCFCFLHSSPVSSL